MCRVSDEEQVRPHVEGGVREVVRKTINDLFRQAAADRVVLPTEKAMAAFKEKSEAIWAAANGVKR
jgi:hypothetical protein